MDPARLWCFENRWALAFSVYALFTLTLGLTIAIEGTPYADAIKCVGSHTVGGRLLPGYEGCGP